MNSNYTNLNLMVTVSILHQNDIVNITKVCLSWESIVQYSLLNTLNIQIQMLIIEKSKNADFLNFIIYITDSIQITHFTSPVMWLLCSAGSGNNICTSWTFSTVSIWFSKSSLSCFDCCFLLHTDPLFVICNKIEILRVLKWI